MPLLLSGTTHGRDLPAAIRRLLRLVWSVTFDAVRDFVWGDLKDGVIDLRGLPLALRALVWLGFALVVSAVCALLVGDLWRAGFDLVPLTQGIPGRGRLVPYGLVPVTLFFLAVAWSFVLAGAIHAHPAIRVATLVLYCLTLAGSTNSSIFSDAVGLFVAGGALLGLLTFFAVRWRARPRPAFDFLVILVLVASASSLLQSQSVNSWRVSGLPVMVTRLQFDVEGLTSLISPLLFLVGMGVAGFAAKMAGWGVAIAEDRLPRRAPYVLMTGVLSWQLWGVIPPAIRRFQEAPTTELLSTVNALGGPLSVALTWLVVTRIATRRGRPDEDLSVEEIRAAVDRWAPRLIVAYTAPVLLAYLISVSALVLVVIAVMFGALYYVQAAMLGALSALAGGSFIATWHLMVDAVALGGALWLAARSWPAPGLYLGIYALLDLKSELSGTGQLLSAFTSPVSAPRADLWWTLIIVGVGLYWLVRGHLTRRRAGHLLFLGSILILLGQTGFISNRFSPFFGFAGIAFLAFGIVWDALTIGSWANVDSRALPRTSRIFLYLGYTLLTVAVVNWAVASHDLGTVGRLTGDIGLVGLDRFGRPMLYAIMIMTLTLPRVGRATPEELGIDSPEESVEVAPPGGSALAPSPTL